MAAANGCVAAIDPDMGGSAHSLAHEGLFLGMWSHGTRMSCAHSWHQRPLHSAVVLCPRESSKYCLTCRCIRSVPPALETVRPADYVAPPAAAGHAHAGSHEGRDNKRRLVRPALNSPRNRRSCPREDFLTRVHMAMRQGAT